MLRPTDRLHELEARDERERGRSLTYADALERYAALWREAQALNPSLGADWADDLTADLALARAVNGLPPAA
jgi:hypothetical protein